MARKTGRRATLKLYAAILVAGCVAVVPALGGFGTDDLRSSFGAFAFVACVVGIGGLIWKWRPTGLLGRLTRSASAMLLGAGVFVPLAVLLLALIDPPRGGGPAGDWTALFIGTPIGLLVGGVAGLLFVRLATARSDGELS